MKFNLSKFLSVLNAVAPIVLMSVPGGDKIGEAIPVIVHAIGVAEIRGGTGPEKLARAQEIIADGVTTINATGKIKLSGPEVAKVANDGITAVIGTMHVIQGAKVLKVLPS